jgi:hypothetical protein
MERSHSDILGSTVACTYSRLIAACHVLLRLSSRVILQPASLHQYMNLKLALTLVILQVLRELQYLQCATSLSIRKNFLLIRANLLVPLHDGHCKFSLTKSFISPIFQGEIAYLELWLHTPLHIGIRPLF